MGTYHKVLDWLLRNVLLLALCIVAIAVIGKRADVAMATVWQVVVFECVAIALSGFAVFVFTRVDWIHLEEKDALSKIFLAVHVLVGFVVLGIYFVQWNPPGG